ncbi:hypothetical protein [Serratia sp. M24T3]|uniref:hypothetical protein n=1 Tax=Serratia sp. M24T3 TaxID=932213 RepID=UPI0012F50680|nr:hypothetical protein [Serratia sp. M24T3]
MQQKNCDNCLFGHVLCKTVLSGPFSPIYRLKSSQLRGFIRRWRESKIAEKLKHPQKDPIFDEKSKTLFYPCTIKVIKRTLSALIPSPPQFDIL